MCACEARTNSCTTADSNASRAGRRHPSGLGETCNQIAKNNKASGADGIPVEVLNCVGEALDALLHAVFEVFYKTSRTLALLLCTRIKEVDRTVCNSHRRISLCSVAGKVLARVLLPWLQVIADKVLPMSGSGFRALRQPLIRCSHLRQLQEKHLELQRPLYVAFIDLTKTFDLVGRSGLFAILRRIGCPATLLSIILKLHDGMHETVQVDRLGSRPFPIKRSVKLGRILAPNLFAIFFTAVLIRVFPKPSGVLLPCCASGKLFTPSRLRAKSEVRRLFIRELVYADDTAFVATSTLQNFCRSFVSACAEYYYQLE